MLQAFQKNRKQHSQPSCHGLQSIHAQQRQAFAALDSAYQAANADLLDNWPTAVDELNVAPEVPRLHGLQTPSTVVLAEKAR